MAKGGLRPNAGRKKANHTIQAEKAREFVIRKVTENLTPLMESQLDAAVGHKYLDPREGKVYTKSPDINAGKYLLDQTIGKAKETIEHQGLEFTFPDEN